MALRSVILASGPAVLVVSRALAETLQHLSMYAVDSYRHKSTHPYKGLNREDGKLRTFVACYEGFIVSPNLPIRLDDMAS